jgi:hypothetical protein
LLWVDPTVDLALVALCSTAFGPWAKEAWPAVSDAVLTETEVVDREGTEPDRMAEDGPT